MLGFPLQSTEGFIHFVGVTQHDGSATMHNRGFFRFDPGPLLIATVTTGVGSPPMLGTPPVTTSFSLECPENWSEEGC